MDILFSSAHFIMRRRFEKFESQWLLLSSNVVNCNSSHFLIKNSDKNKYAETPAIFNFFSKLSFIGLIWNFLRKKYRYVWVDENGGKYLKK